MSGEHFHLIGIGGTGMTALAGLLREAGHRVTGSDRKLYPPMSEILERLDLEVAQGFDAGHLRPAPDRVVVGNAISRGNPELEEVLDRRLSYSSMPRLLAERFLVGRRSQVAGTHGKTTTASLLAWILMNAERDPGFLIGGVPVNFDLPFRLGRGEPFVVEGDEYDTAFDDKGPKFMHYRPDTAVLGTVEFDHADIYRDLDQVRAVFRRLVLLVPRKGLLVRFEDCPTTVEISTDAPCRVQGFGFDRGEWRVKILDDGPDGARFRVYRRGAEFGSFRFTMSGRHNVANAVAALVACHDLGLSAREIGAGFESFRGVRRRLELRGSVDGVRVLDDFAHHPTAIAGTLQTVRQAFPGSRVWAVLEPRSWSMRRNVFQQRLVTALGGADGVVLARVFGAEAIDEAERLDVSRLIKELEAGGTDAHHIPQARDIVRFLLPRLTSGDVVLIMSNGGFDGLHDRLLAELRSRTGSADVKPATD